jgi:cyclic pyranopterin phosphate synthase
MGAMSKDEIREAFREVVANRVPYYGEYMIRDGDGGWEVNDEYVGA